MVVTEYNKLVRDNIPQIIEASGKKPTWYELGDKDFLTALQCKVTEEIKELTISVTITKIPVTSIRMYQLTAARLVI